jgi:hypothetical protein
MPYDPPSDGDVLTAAYFLANVTDQGVSQVDSGSNPSGVDGQIIHESDTRLVKIYDDVDASDWVTLARTAGAESWTPQIDQGATTNIANTIVEAGYVRMGGLIICWANLSVTAAGTAANGITVTLPVTSTVHAAGQPVGSFFIVDATVTHYTGTTLTRSGGATVDFRASGNTSAVGAAPNFALANGDSIRFIATYLAL